TTTSDATSRFTFTGVPFAEGANALTVRATDVAGNATESSRIITRILPCAFASDLGGWTVSETGGSPAGHGTVVAQSGDAVLREGDSFTVSLERTFTIPTTPSVLTFDFTALAFDMASQNTIKDAFEAAFVDAAGKTLVSTIASGKDAFFNLSE